MQQAGDGEEDRSKAAHLGGSMMCSAEEVGLGCRKMPK